MLPICPNCGGVLYQVDEDGECVEFHCEICRKEYLPHQIIERDDNCPEGEFE